MTQVSISGAAFRIDGRPTYAGRVFEGQRIEGLLLNSRMVQAVFDDENPETAAHWRYPDTGEWDPERNTNEFCSALTLYRRHGLLAVTVGLQGGGAIYRPDVYDRYVNSAFAPDGSLKGPYLDRLRRVLAAADSLGMVVIVNYFYWKQESRLEDEDAVRRAARAATEWLLATEYWNILVDVRNEIGRGDGLLQSGRIHELVELIQGTTRDGRSLLTGVSTHPRDHLPPGAWSHTVDFFLPHGNDSTPTQLTAGLRALKSSEPYEVRPRPLLINEDSVVVKSLDAAVAEYASWGFYCQGYGSGYRDRRWDWTTREREVRYSDLSGYQTPPVNWGINTPLKRAFFDRVAEITGCDGMG
jgi:hypothetical protein